MFPESTQGVVQVDWDNQLDWILAPHKNWGKSGRDGNGEATSPFLLKAIDANGTPYSGQVQLGNISDKDFDFPWGQHAPELLPNGNLLLFDNGTFRNFIKKPNYSRAVEYEIDASQKTVKQIWQYGKERQNEFFSLVISDVDYLQESGNVLITSGFIQDKGKHYAKIVEVEYPNKKEVFEATVYFKDVNGNKTFAWGQFDILYRSERFSFFLINSSIRE